MTGPNVSLSPLPGWRRHSWAQDRGQNLFRRRERAPEGVTGRTQGITPTGRARKRRACVSSVQTAHKTRANFTAEQARQPGRLGAWALTPAGAWLPCSPPPGRGSSEQSTQDRMPPFMRDFFPTGKFKNARIAPHNRRPRMAVNTQRFSREATYAHRCLRGRSCVRGRVVPCPAPQPGKVSGMGMQDRRPPRMRKKFPHQDSTLPPSLCPIRTPGPYPQQAYRCWIFRQRWFLYPGAPRTFPRRPGPVAWVPCKSEHVGGFVPMPGGCSNSQALADLGVCLVLLKSAGACRFVPLSGCWKSDSAVGFAAALASWATRRRGGCTP